MSIRVLHVVHSLDPGGMENGVCNIACGLTSRGIEAHVACIERRGAFAGRLPQPDHVYVMGKSGGFSPRAVWSLMNTIRRVKPQVLHTHNLGPLIYASLATLGGRTRPIIHGEHALLAPWEREPRRLRQRSKLYRGCRAIHTVSDTQLRELQRLGLASGKLVAISNGVDTVRFCPGERAAAKIQLDLPADCIALGLVGRYGAYKRHDALLAAFEQMASQFPKTHLVFIGAGGPEEERIRNLAAASSVSPRIHLAGFHADPAPCYRALDLLIIPSVNEGMSNAALEAMSSGVPVLGNAGCGHEQFLTSGHDGIIADLSNPADIASALTAILSTPERLVDLARCARTTIETRFSITRMLDAYEQLYRAHAR